MRAHENPSDRGRLSRANRPSRLIAGIIVLVAGVAVAAAIAPPVAAADVALVVVDVTKVAEGYRASKLRGTKVVNTSNEKIGEIDDLIVSKDRVLFAIMKLAAFWALAVILSPCPISSLQINEDGSRIVLPGATKERVEGPSRVQIQIGQRGSTSI